MAYIPDVVIVGYDPKITAQSILLKNAQFLYAISDFLASARSKRYEYEPYMSAKLSLVCSMYDVHREMTKKKIHWEIGAFFSPITLPRGHTLTYIYIYMIIRKSRNYSVESFYRATETVRNCSFLWEE